jgi:predicted GNAT family N-acyltransferase
MRLRRYSVEDKQVCLDIFDSNVPKFFADWERIEFVCFLDELDSPYFVVENDAGNVIACGGYRIRQDQISATITWLLVMSSQQHKGVGQQILLTCLYDIHQRGRVTSVSLKTSQHVSRFYEKAGFVLVNTIKDGFAPGLDRCDMILTLDVQHGQ